MPDWISNNALPTKSEKMQVSFPMGSGQVPTYLFGELAIRVEIERLTIMPTDFSDDLLITTETTAKNICEKLGYTPTAAVGLNFHILDAQPESARLEIFATEDNLRDSIPGSNNVSTNITKCIAVDDSRVSVSQALNAEGYLDLKINHEWDFQTSKDIADFLNNSRFVNAKKRTMELLGHFNIDENDLTTDLYIPGT